MPILEGTRRLQAELAAKPEDARLREKLVRALLHDGEPAEAAQLLTSFINLTAHDDQPLPCLCRQHLDPFLMTAETGGVSFRRGFAITGKRILYYWIPEELERDAAAIAHAVRMRLAPRLRQPRKPKVW